MNAWISAGVRALSGLALAYAPALAASIRITEEAVMPGAAHQHDGAVSGNIIAYVDMASGNLDIFYRDLDEPFSRPVSVGDGDQTNPVVNGDYIIFEDHGDGFTDLMLYTISVDYAYTLIGDGFNNYFAADMWGTFVVYVSDKMGTNDIYAYDLWTAYSIPVAATDNHENNPSLSGEVVAWDVFEDGSYNVYAAYLGGEPFVVANGSGHEQHPSVDDYRISYVVDGNVALHDLVTGETRQITSDSYYKENVVLAGDHIVWSDDSNGDYDVFLHEISTGLTFQLTGEHHQIANDFDGARVVFEDDRNGYWNIWTLTFEINHEPVADAGPDQDVSVGEPVQLAGSATDPDDDPIVSWLWTIEAAPAGSSAALSDPAVADPAFTPDLPGEYVLSLVAGDGTDPSLPDTVTVSASLSPVVTTLADSGAGSLRLAAGALPAGTTITFAPALSGATILLTSGDIALDRDLVIDATALPGGITLSGDADGSGTPTAGDSRIFQVAGGAVVTLRGLTLRGGYANGANPGNLGGAIFNQGTLAVEACCLADNTAAYAGGAITNFGTLTVGNSTLSRNATQQNAGGAIANSVSATLTVSGSTLAANFAAASGGAIANPGALTIENSIVAGNSALIAAPNISGAIDTELGVNLIDDLAGISPAPTGAVIVLAPDLAPLGRCGGPTPTMLPLPGSPAVDASATGLPADQRGMVRPIGSGFDLGAVEVFPPDEPLVDTDGDTMDDRLEPLYGLSASDPADGAPDADGDGQPNAAELRCRTDPHDASSCLRITAFTLLGTEPNGDRRCSLTWTTFPGLSYEIHAGTTLPVNPAPPLDTIAELDDFTETAEILLPGPRAFVLIQTP